MPAASAQSRPASEAAPESLTLELSSPAEDPCLRADAARNRTRLLAAAARLVEERGAANLTMDAVAAAASVGKGTVFRRFGDRNGLLQALLDRAEAQLQESFMTGPPPLGPGADPLERLRAFGPAVLRHETAHRDLYLAAEPEPARRFLVPAFRVRLTHLAMLLRQAGVVGDLELIGHTLMASLDIALVHHQVEQRGMPLKRLETGWTHLITQLTCHRCSG